ncbi:hypothetical protein AgCh_009779 [Apium graveolens]
MARLQQTQRKRVGSVPRLPDDVVAAIAAEVGAECLELDDDAYYIVEHDMMFEEYLLETGEYETPTTIFDIEDIASSIITQENIENNHVICVSCLEEFGVGETLKVLPCSHYFLMVEGSKHLSNKSI